jgi:hypothetical protein
MLDVLFKAAPLVNRGLAVLMDVPLLRPHLARFLTVVTYTGRRSGRTFSTPVGYKRSGDEVTITVVAPDHKRWWRNFLGTGGPISMELDGAERTGHAVAERTGRTVTVTVRLAAGPLPPE